MDADLACKNCGDVLTKKKLDPHRNQCYGASFTCLDCMVHFPGNSYRTHTVGLTRALPAIVICQSGQGVVNVVAVCDACSD